MVRVRIVQKINEGLTTEFGKVIYLSLNPEF